jgi:hypothetical protein
VPDTEGPRYRFVGGVGQDVSVVADENRERAGGVPGLGQQRPTPRGVCGVEGEREPSALKQVTDLVGARRPPPVDQSDHSRLTGMLALPTGEKFGHEVMKVLVR